MKKICMVLMAAILPMMAWSQRFHEGALTLQPKAGIIASNMWGDDADFDCIAGLMTGVEMEYGLTDMLGLSGGLQFNMLGACSDINDDTWRLNYISMPMLFNVHLAQGRLALKSGIEPAANVFSKVEGVKVKRTRDFDMMVPMGVSYTFDNGLTLDARYRMGFLKVLKHSDVYNMDFSFTLGYKFSLR